MQADFGQIGDILESMSDAFYAVDRAWRFTYVNRKAEELWGRTKADLLGRVIWEVFPGAVGTYTHAQQLRAAAEGVSVTYETVSPVVGRWIRVTAYPNPAGLAVYFHDIHDRKLDDEERTRLLAAERQARAQAEQAAQRTARLQAITAALSNTLTPAEVVELVLRDGAGDLGSHAGGVSMLSADERQLELVAAYGYPEEIVNNFGTLTIETPVPGPEAVRSGEPVWVESHDDLVRQFPYLAQFQAAGNFEAVAAVPLIVEGRAQGVISFSFPSARRFEAAERAYLVALARQCAQALERARLYQAEREARRASEQAAERAQRLSTVVAALSQALTLEEMGRVVTAQVVAALEAQAGTLAVLDPTGTELVLVGYSGYTPESVARWQHFPLASGTPVTDAMRRREVVLVSSLARWGDCYPHVPRFGTAHQAWAAAPLVVEGQALGGLGLAFAEPRAFSPDDQSLLLTLAGHAAQALARVRAYADLEARVRERTAALERSLAEHTLAEGRFRDLLEAAPDAIVIADDAARIVLVNSQTEALLGYARHELLGQPVEMIMPERFRPVHTRHWEPYMGAPRKRSMGEDFTLTALRRDGSELPVEISLSPLETSAGLVVLAALRDLTERQHAQTQLRRLSAYLQESVEAERKRIALQVHDELGQALTSLKMGLVQLDRRADRPPAEREAHVQAMLAEIDETIVTVRRISTELRPSILDDLGLVAAVEWQCQEFEGRTGTDCRLDVQLGDVQVAPEAATAVFRVLQETLTNIIRHAQASLVQVTLRGEHGQLLLEVRDNGRGITLDEIGDRHSLGLLGMRERVAAVHGRVDISGVPGQGTAVQIIVPLSEST